MSYRIAFLFIIITVLCFTGTTYAQEHITVTGDNGVQFTIQSVEFRDTDGKNKPENQTFVVMFGQLKNTTGSRQCVYAGQVELKIGDNIYSPDASAMQSIQSGLTPKIDYIGVIFGQCLKARETVSTFVAFDAEPFTTFQLTFLARKVSGSLSSASALPTTPAPTRASATPQPTTTSVPRSNVSSDAIFTVKGTRTVNIRSCNSTDCSILSTSNPGDVLNVTQHLNEWYEVMLDDGQLGYISASLVSVSLPVVSATATRPSVVSAFDESEYVGHISDVLFIAAGGRNVQTIRVADGHAKGGERVILVSYLTTESTQPGYVEEWIDLFSAIATAIDIYDLDVDSVALVAGEATGQAAGALVTSVDDLMAFYRGEINRATFLSRLQTTAF